MRLVLGMWGGIILGTVFAGLFCLTLRSILVDHHNSQLVWAMAGVFAVQTVDVLVYGIFCSCLKEWRGD